MTTERQGAAVQAALGARVRTRRVELCLSQEALANAAGLHRTYVGSVERGERNVALVNIVRIAAALGIDPGELVAGLRTLGTGAGGAVGPSRGISSCGASGRDGAPPGQRAARDRAR
jgi:DNA-binding XRE family transcriptional regulator